MLQPVQRILAWIYASLPLVLLTATPAFRAQANDAEGLLSRANSVGSDLTLTDLLVFGVLGLGAASAAVAVRMVRRWR